MWNIIVNKFHKIFGNFGRPFYFLWIGESVALLGASLMEFALGAWVYQKTGSVSEFSGVIVASILPMLVVMPFAGSVADRFNRRYLMISADITLAVMTMVLAWLLWRDSLEIQYLYVFNTLVALVAAFRMPAYNASITDILSKDKFVQASGLMGTSANLMSMFSPLMAGGLMAAIGLPGIVSIDLVSFCVGSILVFRAFSYSKKGNTFVKNNSAITDDMSILAALRIFYREPLIFGLFVYAVMLSGLLTLVSTMIIPLALSRYTTQELGIILTFGGIGGLCGALTLVVSEGAPRHVMAKVLLSDAILGGCIIVAGANTSLAVYCVCAFFAIFFASFSEGCSHSLWMRKIPLDFQGRMFSIIGASALAVNLVVLFFGAIFVDNVLEPAMMSDGGLASSVGSLIGTGKGRGLGLMFVICGVLGFLLSMAAFATRLPRLDILVPDVK